jgi:hypothetical protein
VETRDPLSSWWEAVSGFCPLHGLVRNDGVISLTSFACRGYYVCRLRDLSVVAECLKAPSWTLQEAGRAGKLVAAASQVVPA